MPYRSRLSRSLIHLILIPLLVLVTFAGCQPEAETSAPPPPPPSPAASVPQVDPAAPQAATDAAALDRAARLLAGLSLPEGATPPAHPEIWARHATRMDATWRELESRYLGAIRTWSSANLATVPDPAATLFYPFGGPDFLNAVAFFPQAQRYVLGGLEPPGRLPDIDALDADELETELGRLHSGLRNVVQAGYFVTKQMEQDFTTGQPLDGLLPVLYIFLARTGHQPLAAHYVAIGPNGSLDEVEGATPGAGGAVRITFRRAEDPESAPRTLVYMSRDVSNAGLVRHPEALAFVEGLAPFNTYMKSASYLLHMPEFSELRRGLLDGAWAVLQDDSGLPLRTMAPEIWDLRFFGVYTKTLAAYRQWLQEDMLAIYREQATEITALDFAIGYHHRIGGGALILAARRSAQ